jgi:hypothetical protein
MGHFKFTGVAKRSEIGEEPEKIKKTLKLRIYEESTRRKPRPQKFEPLGKSFRER